MSVVRLLSWILILKTNWITEDCGTVNRSSPNAPPKPTPETSSGFRMFYHSQSEHLPLPTRMHTVHYWRNEGERKQMICYGKLFPQSDMPRNIFYVPRRCRGRRVRAGAFSLPLLHTPPEGWEDKNLRFPRRSFIFGGIWDYMSTLVVALSLT